MTLNRILALLLTSFSLISCSVVDLLGTLETTDFPGDIYGVKQAGDGYLIVNDADLCVYIVPEQLWEVGDFWNDMSDDPYPTITLNGRVMPRLSIQGNGVLYVPHDADGNILGTYGGSISYCLRKNTDLMDYNILSATIESTSGIVYRRIWVIRR